MIRKTLLMAVLASAVTLSAYGKDFEAVTGASIGSRGGWAGTLAVPTDGSQVKFSFGGELNYRLTSAIQLSVPVDLGATFGSASFAVAVGPQYNFNSGDLLNSFFAAVRPGANFSPGGTNVILNGIVGKRFKLTESASFRPAAGLNVIFGTGVSYFVTPVSFSVQL